MIIVRFDLIRDDFYKERKVVEDLVRNDWGFLYEKFIARQVRYFLKKIAVCRLEN